MTSKERVIKAFMHQTSDRTPCFEYVLLSPIADIVLGEQNIDFMNSREIWDACVAEIGFENAVRKLARQRVTIAKKLGHDMMYTQPNPMPPPFIEVYPENVPDDATEPEERIQNRIKRVDTGKPHDDTYLLYQMLFEEMRVQGVELEILVPCYTLGVWTDVDLMQTMILDEDIASAYFDVMLQKAQAFAAKYLEYGIKLIGVGGDFAGNRLLISPESYRKYMVPRLKKLTDQIHTGTAFAINASDGNLWPVIDDFLLHSGVDGYLEIDQRAKMELDVLKKRFGDRITFLGNMDCGEVLSFWTPEQIAAETVRCIENGLGNGGHIFCASNAITHSVPLENYLAMVNAYKDYFHLPRVKL